MSNPWEGGRAFSISEQLLDMNVQRFRGRLIFKANRLLDHSTLGWRVMQKKRRTGIAIGLVEVKGLGFGVWGVEFRV